MDDNETPPTVPEIEAAAEVDELRLLPDCTEESVEDLMDDDDLTAMPESEQATEAEKYSWRAMLLPESRQKIVCRLVEMFKNHLPDDEKEEELQEIWKIAVLLEENMHSAPASQSDYLKKLSLDMMAVDSGNLKEILSMQSELANSVTNPDYIGWTFACINVILEAVSMGFDQASSPKYPQYALVALAMSFISMVFCIGELIHNARKDKVTLKRQGRVWWFYYPNQRDKPFGTFPDIFGSICAILQFIFSIIQYAYFSRHADNPIRISILPLIFATCVACSRFLRRNKEPPLISRYIP